MQIGIDRLNGKTDRLQRLPIVEALVEAQPDAILEELCERFAQKSGVSVSIPTMQRATVRLGLSVKKTLVAGEQDTQRVQDLRFAHRLWSFSSQRGTLVRHGASWQSWAKYFLNLER